MEQSPAGPVHYSLSPVHLSPVHLTSPDGSPEQSLRPGLAEPTLVGSGQEDIEDAVADKPLPTLMMSRKPENAEAVKPEIKAEDKIGTGQSAQAESVGREHYFIGEDESPHSEGSDPAAGEAKRVRWAKLVSYASLLASVTVAGFGIGIGIATHTLSLVGLGLEGGLDGLSSALVLWRFKTGKPRQHENAEAAAQFKAKRDALRERNSGLGIGATFIASACLLFFSAIHKATSYNAEDANHAAETSTGANWTVLLSMPAALAFGTLAVAKFRLAVQLRSQVLEKDALCSLLGALLALIVSVAGLLEEAVADARSMAAVDSVASAVIAAVLLFEGSRTLKHNVATPESASGCETKAEAQV